MRTGEKSLNVRKKVMDFVNYGKGFVVMDMRDQWCFVIDICSVDCRCCP